MPKRTVIIVLGYDVTAEGELVQENILRLEKALELYRAATDVFILTGKWTPEHGPDFSPAKTEAAAMRDFLLGKGVVAVDIICEDEATSTIANAVNTLPLVTALRPEIVKVVTSSVHLRRAREIFSVVYAGYELQYIGSATTLAAEEPGLAEVEKAQLIEKLRSSANKGNE